MARNFKEAVEEVVEESGHSPKYIIDNELVMEVEAEEDTMEFVVWVHDDGTVAKPGTPIGYEVTDGTSDMFHSYDQYTDQDELRGF